MFRRTPERANDPLSFQAWLDYTFSYNGQLYPITGMGVPDINQSVGSGLEGFTRSFLKSNGIVYACMALRLRIFSDIRFGFRDLQDGRPGNTTSDLDGRNPASKGLRLLQAPEPGLTTGDLLAHMIQDVDLAGNAFVLRQADRLTRLRPDWVTVVYGTNKDDATPWDRDAELVGYFYQEGGPERHKEPVFLFPELVAHWAPMPDPLSPRLGMSWLTPVIREILADSSASRHKLAFFDNDATINQQLVFDKGITKEQFELAKEAFNEQHQGARQAYKTLFALGAKLEPVGLDFKAMDFTAIQGRGETRIASAAGIHPVLVAFSEGLQGSSLNAGNFASARRATADMTFRPLWRNLCGSLAHIIDTPPGKELWYFDNLTQFLQEDRKDAAEIEAIKSSEVENLIRAGFEAQSVVDAVMAEDLSLLKHTGLFSIQLQAPGSNKMPQGEAPGEHPVAGDGPPEKPAVNPAANGKTPAALSSGGG